MKHVRPYSIGSDRAVSVSGRVLCPYCGAESTDDPNAQWVEAPITRSPPRLICLGCCEDIYSACADDDLEAHPYYDVVVDAASKEGVSVTEFRKRCIQQQLEASVERKAKERTNRYDERAARLRTLLRELDGSG